MLSSGGIWEGACLSTGWRGEKAITRNFNFRTLATLYEGMNKYRNQKTMVDGYLFDSKKEAARYGELKLMFRAKKLVALELQPKFPIVVNGKKICTYIADFSYDVPFIGNDSIPPVRVVEDVKGIKTPIYRLKKKLVEAIYGVTIQEV